MMLPVRLFQLVFDRLAALYGRQLGWVLEHPLATVSVALVLLGASLTLYGRLGEVWSFSCLILGAILLIMTIIFRGRV